MSAAAAWAVASPGPLRETTVWHVDLALDEVGRRACLDALSGEERARTERFLRLEDRDRYAGSHAALRRILAAALDADPAALRFRTNQAGKPALDAPWRGRLAFNLSHSGTCGLIALSPEGRIGVDVELMRPIPDCLGLARGHFAPGEVASLTSVPPDKRQAAFYACWTRKEAFVKALGLGLSFRLDRFAVTVPPEQAALLTIDGSAEAAGAWSLQHLDPLPGHVGAVVVEGRGRICSRRSLEPGWATAAT